jgi:hypothetical protein
MPPHAFFKPSTPSPVVESMVESLPAHAAYRCAVYLQWRCM